MSSRLLQYPAIVMVEEAGGCSHKALIITQAWEDGTGKNVEVCSLLRPARYGLYIVDRAPVIVAMETANV